LERNEFNRIPKVSTPPYETLICQGDAYSIIHLFLHDYGDAKILSFCGGNPFLFIMSEQDIWDANKRAIFSYRAANKDLKLIWERDPKTERIIRIFQSLRDLGTDDSLSFSFGGKTRTFYILNIPNSNIREFQHRVRLFPATPELIFLPEGITNVHQGEEGSGNARMSFPFPAFA